MDVIGRAAEVSHSSMPEETAIDTTKSKDESGGVSHQYHMSDVAICYILRYAILFLHGLGGPGYLATNKR